MERVTLDQLKLMIAALMGYTNIHLRKQGGIRYFVGNHLGDENPSVIPNYPRKISAAWQVVEFMLHPPEATEAAMGRAETFRALCDEGEMWVMPASRAGTQICIYALAARGIMVEVIEEPGCAR